MYVRRSSFLIALLVFLFSFASPSICHADELKILSPADGSVIKPGQTVPVKLRTSFPPSKILVIPSSTMLIVKKNDSDGGYTLEIDPRAPINEYTLTALSAANNIEKTAQIKIWVDTERKPASIDDAFSPLHFDSKGEELPQYLIASYSDGTKIDIYKSKNLTRKSSNPKVATVDENGVVRAIGSGGAVITTTYNGLSINTPVIVELSENDTPEYNIDVTLKGPITEDPTGNYAATVTLTNNSNVKLWNMSLKQARLNSASALVIMANPFTNVPSNESRDVQILFSPLLGSHKDTATLEIEGTVQGNLLNGEKSQDVPFSYKMNVALPELHAEPRRGGI